MATTETNLADRSGNLVESHKNYDPRIVFFYFILAGLLLTLVVGLAYRQLTKTDEHASAERQQNQRRVLFPGPRGNIYDRNGRQLVGNNHRFGVVLHLEDLKVELDREQNLIRRNFLRADEKDMPTLRELRQISRVSVVQRYLDQLNRILGRSEKVDVVELQRHFDRQLLLPYELLVNLEPNDYARLIENLPVNSPLEVYASIIRTYPYKSSAAHAIGYVRADAEVVAPGFPGQDLTTFKMPGTKGKAGLEKYFDAHLRGEAGGRIYLVDPTGYKISKPLEERKPKQGKHLAVSLDIDLQLAAEEAIGDQIGAAAAIDVNTGEVLVLASLPSYDLNDWYPRMSVDTYKAIQEKGAEFNRAVDGFYPPGSTFKILTTIAGLRRGVITPDQPIVFCNRYHMVGNKQYPCDVGNGHHGNVLLRDAIAQSCDIYYYKAAELMTPEFLAAEGRRFHLDQRTGIELPEPRRMIMPDPEWKLRERKARWVPGDTANMSIGQGDVLVSPLQMACFTASVARGQLFTTPTLVHDPNRRPLQNESIGLTPAQRLAIFEGMEGTITRGTGRTLMLSTLKVPGVRLAGKTGTAQKQVTQDGKIGNINLAWFICFAPAEKPEIAVAVMIEGETIGEDFYGGHNAGPVVSAILKKYFEKKANPIQSMLPPIRTE